VLLLFAFDLLLLESIVVVLCKKGQHFLVVVMMVCRAITKGRGSIDDDLHISLLRWFGSEEKKRKTRTP
jgi:hypothetical protein